MELALRPGPRVEGLSAPTRPWVWRRGASGNEFRLAGPARLLAGPIPLPVVQAPLESGGTMTLEQRVAALEDAVKQLGVAVEADIESLQITDAEVARQGHGRSPRLGWHVASDGHR